MTGRNQDATHTFEARGLGVAPFQVVDVDVHAEALGTCDFCGRAIRVYVTLRGTDGREFSVGHDCAERSGDRGILTPRYAARVKRAKAIARDLATHEKVVAGRERLFAAASAVAAEGGVRPPERPVVPSYASLRPRCPLGEWVEAAVLGAPHAAARAIEAADPEFARRCAEAADVFVATSFFKPTLERSAAASILYSAVEMASHCPSVVARAERMRADYDAERTSLAMIEALSNWWGWDVLASAKRTPDASLRERAARLKVEVCEFRERTEFGSGR